MKFFEIYVQTIQLFPEIDTQKKKLKIINKFIYIDNKFTGVL